MKKWKGTLLASIAACALAGPVTAGATTLVINSGLSNPAPKKAFANVVKAFEKTHPNIKVQVNVYGHESEKTAIRNWLVADPPDLVYWYPGTRMMQFVKPGLFAPLTGLWNKIDFKDKVPPGVSEQLTWHGKQWGMPYSYYLWGIYYRKDLFNKYDLSPPKTWKQLLHDAAVLKKHHVTPFALGDEALWPAAGWFDYLDLRTNGFKFHERLMHGKVPYTDPRVKKVFEHWATLVKKGYFTANATSYRWQDAQGFLFKGKAAMFLIGSFMVPNIPAHLKKDIGFFRFPVINPKVPMAEEAPIDMFAMPAKAKHKKAAEKFLAFMVKPRMQTIMNDALGQLPVVQAAKPPQNPLLIKQFHIVASVKHFSQYFDRDNKPEMAKKGMDAFQEFLAYPNRIDSILKKLERARKRIYQ